MGEDPEIDWAGEGDKEWMESGDDKRMGELIGDVVCKCLWLAIHHEEGTVNGDA